MTLNRISRPALCASCRWFTSHSPCNFYFALNNIINLSRLFTTVAEKDFKVMKYMANLCPNQIYLMSYYYLDWGCTYLTVWNYSLTRFIDYFLNKKNRAEHLIRHHVLVYNKNYNNEIHFGVWSQIHIRRLPLRFVTLCIKLCDFNQTFILSCKGKDARQNIMTAWRNAQNVPLLLLGWGHQLIICVAPLQPNFSSSKKIYEVLLSYKYNFKAVLTFGSCSA